MQVVCEVGGITVTLATRELSLGARSTVGPPTGHTGVVRRGVDPPDALGYVASSSAIALRHSSLVSSIAPAPCASCDPAVRALDCAA